MIDNSVINLSSYRLTDSEGKILKHGLGFVPSRDFDLFQTILDVNRLVRDLTLRKYFTGNDITENVMQVEPIANYDDLAFTDICALSNLEALSHGSIDQIHIDKISCRMKSRSNFYPIQARGKGLEVFHNRVVEDLTALSKQKGTSHSNLTRKERKAINSLQNNDSIVIRQSDKGGSVVVLDKSTYTCEALRQLNDPKAYTSLRRDPTMQYQSMLKDLLYDGLEMGIIDRKSFDCLLVDNPVMPIFHHLPKVHKSLSEIKGRPIVAGIGSLLEPLSKWVDQFLQPLVHNLPSYLRDTTHTLSKLEKITWKQEYSWMAIDVVSLYSSIPHEFGIEAIKFFLDRYTGSSHEHKDYVLRVIDFLLKHNFFKFSDVCYLQRCNFTVEWNKTTIHYLDVTLTSDYTTGRITSSLYRKPISGNSLLHAQSNHPGHVFKGIVKAQFLRAKQNCTLEKDFKSESKLLTERLLARDYPRRVINRAKKEVQLMERNQLLVPKNERQNSVPGRQENKQKPLFITSYSNQYYQVCNIIRRNLPILRDDQKLRNSISDGCQFIYKRNMTLGNILSPSLLKTNKAQNSWLHFKGTFKCGKRTCKSCEHVHISTTFVSATSSEVFETRGCVKCSNKFVVYLVECTLCCRQYVGRTTREVGFRIKEHLAHISHDRAVSALSRHFLDVHSGNVGSFRWQAIEQIMRPPRGGDAFQILSRQKYTGFINLVACYLWGSTQNSIQLTTGTVNSMLTLCLDKYMCNDINVMFVIMFAAYWGVSSAPTLTLPHNVTLAENVPQNTLVTRISATAATHDVIVGAPFIVNSNPVVHPFTIIPKGGGNWELITTNTPKLNFETVPLYTLQVLVEDNKGTSATQTIVIEITNINQAPIFTGTLAQRDAEVYIAENTLKSTVIYKVAAKDPDNDIVQYSIAPSNVGFQIDPTGRIYTTTLFDYENSTNSYILTVTISDGALSNTASIKVYITNVNDNTPTLSCEFSNITPAGISTKRETSGNTVAISLNEELPIGTAITTCTADDADKMNDLTFLLDPGNAYLSINKVTGMVIIIARMDSEETGFVSVQSYIVKVCDTGLNCASISVSVTILPINDNVPFCDQYLYSFTKPEPIEKDTQVASLRCHDTDIPPNILQYLPNSGPLGPGKLFEQIAANPHVVQLNKELKYDTDLETSYEMTVSVFDSVDPAHTVTATVIVSVSDVNNFDPVFDPATYTFNVKETSQAKYSVGKVRSTDKDRSNCVRYGIINGNTEVINLFWIDRLSGEIQLITQPDFETAPSHTLIIEATDCDPINPRKAEAKVTINIIEENDEAPICKPSTYKAVIYDNVTSGVNINSFRLNCKDRDSNDTAMRFEIVSGNINNHFVFDPTHGSHNPKLIVKTPFDFDNGADMQQKYNLVVHIIDDNVKFGKVEKPRTGTALISITVVRTNTPAPPTTDYYKRKGLTIVNEDVNTYDSTAWYIPFVLTLLAIFCAGLLAWMCYLIWKYGNLKALCQKAKHKMPRKKVRTYKAGTKKEKVEVITETTTYETVFDGEAVDPVTGQMYEFNTKSGARRWKSLQVKEENIKLSDISTVTETLTPAVVPSAPLYPILKE
ncbi:uncharacterized protein LOC128636363 [Bombina bombina]|uniref:uncharacterized protein LOC128636363 n=1 Tax=Bombina bombina TaxID=8345 RepID=UPI00235AD91E|nr:uncharacterized protein LOC128636363 [Bombina bombina]